jgi:hypothetical protein
MQGQGEYACSMLRLMLMYQSLQRSIVKPRLMPLYRQAFRLL